MSNVRTVPSTLPAIISVFVRQIDITLSRKVSMICKSNKTSSNQLFVIRPKEKKSSNLSQNIEDSTKGLIIEEEN